MAGLHDLGTAAPGDDIARQLNELSSQSDVEAELAKLKGLNAPAAPQAIAQGDATAEPIDVTATEVKPEAQP